MTLLEHPIAFLLIVAAACASTAESKQKLNVIVILAADPCGGTQLSSTLNRPVKQSTHIGYSAFDAVTEFSHRKAAN